MPEMLRWINPLYWYQRWRYKRRYYPYRNPDPRCGLWFTPDALGYCWSYAHHVDGTKGYEDMEPRCQRCDEFHPDAREETDA